MTWTVAYRPSAKDELAELWLATPDRHALTLAADEVDRLLRIDPLNCGESRDGAMRLLIMPPLAVFFDVSSDDRMVIIWNVVASD
jgi:hypothetical protein